MALPVCSGNDAIRVFERAGWTKVRQHGSHAHLVKSGNPVLLSVPLHRELDQGLLRALIRKSGMTVDEFAQLFSAI